MKAKSVNEVIVTGDFEEAVNRFNATSPRWKTTWWNAIETIYGNFQEWSRKYIIDPVTRIVRKVGEKIAEQVQRADTKRKRKQYVNAIQVECPIENVNACGTYVVEHYKDGERVWLKVGKAKNLWERMTNQLREYGKKDSADSVIIKAFYPANSEEEALTMENYLRHHFKKDPANGFMRQDRFTNGVWTSAVAKLMDAKHIECRASFG